MVQKPALENGRLLARAVSDENARQRLIAALAQYVEQNKFAGIVWTLKQQKKSAKPVYAGIASRLSAARLGVVQAVP